MEGEIASVHLTGLLVALYNGNGTFAGNDSKINPRKISFTTGGRFATNGGNYADET